MKRHNVVKCCVLLSTKNNRFYENYEYLSNISIRSFVPLAYPLLFLNLLNLLSVYFVNSLVMLLLCCYFSLYQRIWLYENKDIYVVYKLWFFTSYNLYTNCCTSYTTQKYKLKLVQFWPVQVITVQVITCTKFIQKSVSTCTTFLRKNKFIFQLEN